MTKTELIARLAKKLPNLFQKDVDKIVNIVVDEIFAAIKNDNRVELRGFGAFSLRKRSPRTARNPRNGTDIKIGARNVIYFRAGKELRDKANSK